MKTADGATGVLERDQLPWTMRSAHVRGEAGSSSRRIIVIAGGDANLRRQLRDKLTEIRWTVHNANGGAAAMACLEEQRPEALLLAGPFQDLDLEEFAAWVDTLHPEIDLLRLDTLPVEANTSTTRHYELAQVIRDFSGVGYSLMSDLASTSAASPIAPSPMTAAVDPEAISPLNSHIVSSIGKPLKDSGLQNEFLPEMVGTSAAMKELGRLVRLVAPRSTAVLIEGETGTGKELVAKALHRLSSRANKPFLVLNCAAIPEALLEAELFGHTRGAFTGAVRSRVGRIEAADGGTMFLDEIGEMPLALQAKMLRFLECGELQRVGDNEPSYVDVRVIAATHQPLEQRAEEQTFRLDLYHRLAVFPIEVPALTSRMEDLPLLAGHFLAFHGRGGLLKHLSPEAMDCLRAHHWPGNVRELMHVMERALILSGSSQIINAEDIRLRKRERLPASAAR